MKTIQPFIDLGIHTVPLSGQLKRLENGDKTTPLFEKNWRVKYQEEFNENPTELGGAITGSISNIIAIDCDDQITYDLFKALHPDYQFHFVSKGKPKGGGTIVYKYPFGKSLESFSLQTEIMHLDFYSDNGFVYLPTRANKTKESWSEESAIPELQEIPDTVLTLLLNLQLQYTLKNSAKTVDSKSSIVIRANYLAPQVELMISQKKFIPSLFHIITPKDFRDLPQYVRHGYLHPEEVPEGRGSEYLVKVSAILGADPSINQETYLEAMTFINNLWSYPMQLKKFEATILEPMVNGKSTIDGEVIWQYDEHWKERGLAFTTKLGDAVEVFYDDVRASYYMINYTRDMIKVFYKETDIFSYIEPIAVGLPSRKEMKQMVPVVRTVSEPARPFGFYNADEYSREFNIFRQSPALAILNDPTHYADLYKRPETTIKFFETFIPDSYMRNYVLGFLKTKLTTFRYSPVVLYFIGVHGSGKDTFMNLVGHIIGEAYIAKPVAKEFIEQYNGWLIDKYFAQLDEYGNQLHTIADKAEALGKIKAYTGKEHIQIREMRTDGYKYKHSLTLVMTQNSNPLMLEEDDRRVAMIETPNILKNVEWVQEMGTTQVIENIEREVEDFCYYLATEVNALSFDHYVDPPETDAKRDLIASKLPAAQRIGYYLRHSMFEQVEELMEDSNTPDLLQHAPENRIYEDTLFQMYVFMTEGKGSKRGLTKVLKEHGFDKIPSTKEGHKVYYYHVPTLMHYKPQAPFEPIKSVEIDL